MNPISKLRWTLITALLIWAPIVVSSMSNGVDFSTLGLFFLGAIAIAFIGVEIVALISSGYGRNEDALHAAKRQIEELERRKGGSSPDGSSRRRKDDPGNNENDEQAEDG